MKFGLLFFILLFASHSALAESCSDLFGVKTQTSPNKIQFMDSHSAYKIIELASIYENNKNRFLVNENYKLDLSSSNPTYKGQTLTKIENIGEVNSGIYEFNDPIYGPSILKLYKFSEEKLDELKFLEKGSLVVTHETLEIVSYIRGNLLSQDFNGPKLYDSGFLKPDNGGFYFYIHMERIFPDAPFFSVKDWKNKKNKELVKILRMHPEIIENLKVMRDELAVRNIVPFDPDIAITKDGRIRWLDTDYWELGTPEQARISMEHVIELLSDMKKRSTFLIY